MSKEIKQEELKSLMNELTKKLEGRGAINVNVLRKDRTGPHYRASFSIEFDIRIKDE